MIKTILTTSLDKIEQIVHVSDVHIRNLKRHEEYAQVFKRLYTTVRKLKKANPNTLVYLAGDLAHAKTDMSPELVAMIANFMKTLADITEVVVILGNHDMNIANSYRLDAIGPIVRAINHPGIHFLRETGIYTLANIDFSVMAVFDNAANYIPAVDIDGDNIKIALYHGIVDKAKNDAGTEMINKKVSSDIFNGYDFAMLGDIHTFQYLNRENTIAYASSLVQQGHGELVANHGIIIWNILDKTSEFVAIPNDFGYYTFDVIDGKLQNYDQGAVIKKPRVRLRIHNTSAADVKRISAELKRNHSIQEISMISNNQLSMNSNDLSATYNIANIRDVGHQNELIREYSDTMLQIDPELIDRVVLINDELNSELNLNETIRNVMCKPIKFEFSNMFSFDEGNVIDFQQMNGVYGLFAKNHTGKSAIFDALLFCCFDKCTRTSKSAEIMNNKKTSFTCKFEFELNDVRYFIDRHAYKSRLNAIKVDVNFYYINDSGDTISLNGTERASTNDVIRQYIGTYEDFILTTLSAQNNNTGFIDLSQREKKDLLSNFLDINIFEDLYICANDRMRNVDILIKNLKKQDLATQLSNAQISFDRLTITKQMSEKSIVILKEKLIALNEEKLTLTRKLKSIDAKLRGLTLDSLEEQQTRISTDITFITRQITENDDNQRYLAQQSTENSALLDAIDVPEIERIHKLYTLATTELAALDHKIQLAEASLKNKNEKIEKLGQLKYDENCTFCMDNIFVKDAISTKNDIVIDTDNIEYLGTLRSELTTVINSNKYTIDILDNVKTYKENTQSYQVKGLQIRNTKTQLQLKLQQTTQKLLDVDNTIILYHENEKSIQSNLKISQDIADIDDKISPFQNDLDTNNTEMLRLTGDISVQNNIIDLTLAAISELADLELQFTAYEAYMQCVKRDGIPYKLISSILPVLEAEINTTLSQVVDFRILLGTDGKNINSYIVYDDDNYWSLSITSGMEKFISSLAIRAALIKITNLPKLSFLVIDEGLGNLDADHFNSMYLLFEYLKGQFEFLIVISHLDQARDLVENFLEITQKKEYSHIMYA